jgi:hypothetical protein
LSQLPALITWESFDFLIRDHPRKSAVKRFSDHPITGFRAITQLPNLQTQNLSRQVQDPR